MHRPARLDRCSATQLLASKGVGIPPNQLWHRRNIVDITGTQNATEGTTRTLEPPVRIELTTALKAVLYTELREADE